MESAICVENIGRRERRKRLVFGAAGLLFGAAFSVVTLGDGPSWWRLGLFLPFWGGALGVFEAIDRT